VTGFTTARRKVGGGGEGKGRGGEKEKREENFFPGQELGPVHKRVRGGKKGGRKRGKEKEGKGAKKKRRRKDKKTGPISCNAQYLQVEGEQGGKRGERKRRSKPSC